MGQVERALSHASRRLSLRAAAALSLALLGAVGTVGSPAPAVSVSPSRLAAAPTGGWHPVIPQPDTAADTATESVSARCADPAGKWLGMRWRDTVRWRMNQDSIPAYLDDRAATVAAVRSAAANIASGRNDCGLPENLDMRQRYEGDTDRHAGVTERGACGKRDGHNVVSFGRLTPGTLAVTCVWWQSTGGVGRSVEADIMIDEVGGAFFLNPPPGCAGRWDLESTVTHEFGHVFGLGHVTYDEHPDLTMTDGLPDCSTAYRGVGLGDYLTLKDRYGTR